MSWRWNDEIEKKEYDVKGTVTISTEEYRDLIESMYDLHAKGRKEHEDWYEEYKKREDLEKQVKELTQKIEVFQEWLKSDNLAFANFKNWKIEKIESEDE